MPSLLKKATRHVPLTLAADRGIDPAATFLFRRLDGPQWVALSSTVAAGDDAERAAKSLYDGLRQHLTGWKNLRTDAPEMAAVFGVTITDGETAELPYQPDKLEQMLTIAECGELLRGLLEGQHPGVTAASDSQN